MADRKQSGVSFLKRSKTPDNRPPQVPTVRYYLYSRRLLPTITIISIIAIINIIVFYAAIIPNHLSGEACSKQSSQCAYQIAVIQDRGALFPGWIVAPRQLHLTVGQPYLFLAMVCGSAVFCGSTDPPSSAQPEPVDIRSALKVGARIRATLAGDIPGTIKRLSDETQPVIEHSDVAQWHWLITPSQPGKFEMELSFTPLQTNTSAPLEPATNIRLTLNVTRTTWQKVTAALSGFYHFLTSLGAILTGLGIAAAPIGIWAYKRLRTRTRRSHPEATKNPATTLTAEDSGDSAFGPPASAGPPSKGD